MYTKFYGFTIKPFELLPDPRFLYLSKQHDLALAHLEYGIIDNKGFIVLTGDVGTGKTTLINFFLNKIKEGINSALIFNTNIDPVSFLELVVKEFGLSTSEARASNIYDTLYRFLLDEHVKGRRCALIIDEAQNMSKETLEEVRMLSNFHTEDSYLLQIIMVGQPQLKKRLKDPELAQLTQRVSVYYHLPPLHESEVGLYIDHRLRLAGYPSESSYPLFTNEAVNKIYHYTRGVPRLISSVCDSALTYGYSEEIKAIDEIVIEKVIEDRVMESEASDSELGDGAGSDAALGSLQTEPGNPSYSALDHIYTEIAKLGGRLTLVEQRLDQSENLRNLQITPQLLELFKRSLEEYQEVREKYTILIQNYKKLLDAKRLEDADDKPRKKRRWFGLS